MKVVILAGGYGTRISEESYLKPKPMIEIGGYPVLWHIMKHYTHYGFNEFIICCGYKGYVIKEYFSNYFLHCSDITFDFSNNNQMTVHSNIAEPWKVTLVDTGLDTMTGGRLKKIRKYVGDERFLLTYGDGVSDVNISKLVECHMKSNNIVTLTAIQPSGRFGVIDIDDNNSINSFNEKCKEDMGWINGGFMVLEPDIFKYIDGDETMLERKPLETIAKEGRLGAYRHNGFWQCMDTKRDKDMLEKMWNTCQAQWKTW